jgi:hypothetical protein
LEIIEKIQAKNSDPNRSYSIEKDERTSIENEFAVLCNFMNSGNVLTERNDLINTWLMSNITRSLKNQTGLAGLFSGLVHET